MGENWAIWAGGGLIVFLANTRSEKKEGKSIANFLVKSIFLVLLLKYLSHNSELSLYPIFYRSGSKF